MVMILSRRYLKGSTGSAFGSCTAGRDGPLYSGKFHNRSDEKNCSFFYRTQLSCKVVGITGSVGKTSTKEMIASVFGTAV